MAKFDAPVSSRSVATNVWLCWREIHIFLQGRMKTAANSLLFQIIQCYLGNIMVFLPVPERRIFFQKFV